MEFMCLENNGLLLAAAALFVARSAGVSLLRGKITGLTPTLFGIACVIFLHISRPTFEVPVPAESSVLVTGASRGLGTAVVQAYADQGFLVYAGVRSESDGRKVAEEGRVVPILLDVTKPEQVAAARDKIAADKTRKLIAVVGNAGILGPVRPAELVSLDEYRWISDINYLGNVNLAHYFGPLLRKSGGRFIMSSSVLANAVMPFYAGYQASKVACEVFLETFRRENLKMGTPVAVSLIRIGLTKTDMVTGWTDPVAPKSPSDFNVTMPQDDLAFSWYIENFDDMQEKLRTTTEQHAVPVEDVQPAFIDALMSSNPLTRYYIMPEHKVLSFFIQLLPDHIIDMLYALSFYTKV